jgi:4-aminobutyrate aminotransferase/(S)-3-amino-2-methylpropionate transaminase
MMALELCEVVGQDGDPTRPAPALVKAVIDDCRDKGLLVIAAGVAANCIRVLTPLVITDEQLDRGLDVLCASIERHANAATR